MKFVLSLFFVNYLYWLYSLKYGFYKKSLLIKSICLLRNLLMLLNFLLANLQKRSMNEKITGTSCLIGNLIYLETRLSLRGLDLSLDKSRLLPAKYLKEKATFLLRKKDFSMDSIYLFGLWDVRYCLALLHQIPSYLVCMARYFVKGTF